MMSNSIPTVGSVVRVTTRHRNIYYKTAEIQPWVDTTFEGTVVPNLKWDAPNTFSMTGTASFPIRNIALHNVLQMEVLKGSSAKVAGGAGIRVFQVKSKKNTYTVMLNASKYSCTCVGFQYHRNCRHANAVAAKISPK